MPTRLPLSALCLVALACGGSNGTCDEDSDCDGGYACVTQDATTAQTCATTCVDSFDCAEGFACDLPTDTCVEVNWCTSDADCPDGYGCADPSIVGHCPVPYCPVETTGCYSRCFSENECAENALCLFNECSAL